MSAAVRMTKYTMKSSFSSELVEPDAHRLVASLGLQVYVALDDSDRVMVSAADFNAAMGMNEQSGIKHSFLQDMKSELSNKRRRKQTDGSSADKMFDIVGSAIRTNIWSMKGYHQLA